MSPVFKGEMQEAYHTFIGLGSENLVTGDTLLTGMQFCGWPHDYTDALTI